MPITPTEPSGAQVLVAIDAAQTALSVLLGTPADRPLLGCSAAVVGLDAAYNELAAAGAPVTGTVVLPEPADDAKHTVVAIVALVEGVAAAVRQLIDDQAAPRVALAAARAVLLLDDVVAQLRADLA